MSKRKGKQSRRAGGAGGDRWSRNQTAEALAGFGRAGMGGKRAEDDAPMRRDAAATPRPSPRKNGKRARKQAAAAATVTRVEPVLAAPPAPAAAPLPDTPLPDTAEIRVSAKLAAAPPARLSKRQMRRARQMAAQQRRQAAAPVADAPEAPPAAIAAQWQPCLPESVSPALAPPRYPPPAIHISMAHLFVATARPAPAIPLPDLSEPLVVCAAPEPLPIAPGAADLPDIRGLLAAVADMQPEGEVLVATATLCLAESAGETELVPAAAALTLPAMDEALVRDVPTIDPKEGIATETEIVSPPESLAPLARDRALTRAGTGIRAAIGAWLSSVRRLLRVGLVTHKAAAALPTPPRTLARRPAPPAAP